jgi:hypothetical protein
MRKLDGVVVDANVPQVNDSAANVLHPETACRRKLCVRLVLLQSGRASRCGLNR